MPLKVIDAIMPWHILAIQLLPVVAFKVDTPHARYWLSIFRYSSLLHYIPLLLRLLLLIFLAEAIFDYVLLMPYTAVSWYYLLAYDCESLLTYNRHYIHTYFCHAAADGFACPLFHGGWYATVAPPLYWCSYCLCCCSTSLLILPLLRFWWIRHLLFSLPLLPRLPLLLHYAINPCRCCHSWWYCHSWLSPPLLRCQILLLILILATLRWFLDIATPLIRCCHYAVFADCRYFFAAVIIASIHQVTKVIAASCFRHIHYYCCWYY